MSNREALRKLSKKFPDRPELKKIFDGIRSLDDRSAAIMATALVEAVLERHIIKKLSVSAPDLIGALFHNRGPLSDFHSKILIATAFGVIRPDMAEDLHRMKAIRNVFAHAKISVTFNTLEIAKESSEFTIVNRISDAIHALEKHTPIDLTKKNGFLFFAHIFCTMPLPGSRESPDPPEAEK
jgi:DNA-binding MltR family transcriptional regulator